MKIIFSQSDSPGQESDLGLLVQETRPRLKKPPRYCVIMLNDDYTPMEFVVEVLEKFFGKDRTSATHIMLAIHTKGRAVCGLYPKDIAETKAYSVNKYARESDHPLLCEIEPSLDNDDE